MDYMNDALIGAPADKCTYTFSSSGTWYVHVFVASSTTGTQDGYLWTITVYDAKPDLTISNLRVEGTLPRIVSTTSGNPCSCRAMSTVSATETTTGVLHAGRGEGAD